MAILKRVLLFLAELSILLAGIVAAFALVYHFEAEESPLLVPGFFGILSVSVLAFVLFRRKSHAWKITLDAATFLKDRAVRREHPYRAKIARRLRRALLFFPLFIAAFTLLFLPATSHVAFSSRHLVPHYKFSVPLNWMIIKAAGGYPMAWIYFSNEGAARHGFTPLWFNRSLPSGATFFVTDLASPYEWYRPRTDEAGARATLIEQSTFRIGEMEMNCWEYEARYLHFGSPGMTDAPQILRDVHCSTRPNGRNFNLNASFLGRKNDVPIFYQVVRTAAPE